MVLLVSNVMPQQSKKQKAASASGRRGKWDVEEDLYNVSGAESSEASNGNRTNKQTERRKRVARVERHALQQENGLDSQPSSATDIFAQAIENAKPAFKAIAGLGGLYSEYVENVRNIYLIQQERDDLRISCEKKEAQIDELKIVVRGLERLRGEREEQYLVKFERMKEDRKILDDDKDNFQKKIENGEKRLAATLAEHELAQKKELEALNQKHNEQFAKRKAELEKSTKIEKAELENEVKKLIGSNKQLQAQLDTQQKAVLELQSQLKDEKTKSDEQFRVKESFKDEGDKLKIELGELKKVFSMDGKGAEYYQARFRELYELVEVIAAKQVSELDEAGAGKVRELLKSTNSPFQFMPISQSDVSKRLLRAFVQFSISSILGQTIWQPFSSDKTFANNELASNLEEMVTALASIGNRKSRTMKMLINQSLQQCLPARHSKTCSSTAGSSATSSRSGQAVDKILRLISWHSDPKKSEATKKVIQELVDAAIAVWDQTQVDQLDISARSILDPKLREKWTSLKLEDVTDSKTNLKPDSEIFNLFPCFIALPPPTSPVSTPKNGTEPKAILIHPGCGLPLASRLVTLGMEEESSRQKILDEELERAKERASSRISQGVKQSRGGTTASEDSGARVD